MITRCSWSLSETKCLKNINLTGSTLSKLFKWWWPLTCSHLLPSILFKHKVFHHGKTKCPCRGGRDVTLTQQSFAKETSLQKQSRSLALWIWTYGKGSVHVNVQCGKGLGQRAFCASRRISVSASRAKGFHVQRDKTQGEYTLEWIHK